NYPGFTRMSGNEFAEKLIDQAMALGADIEPGEATGISVLGDRRVVHTDMGDYEGRAVILATGSKHRPLGLDGEEKFVGNGISYCAVCDGAFYKGKNVAMIGGGNSALQETVLLAEGCRKVTVFQNLPYLTGEGRLNQKVSALPNVEIVTSTVVDALLGGDTLQGIRVKNTETGVLTEYTLDGVFVCIGQMPDNAAFAENVEVNDAGYIVADESCRTKDPAVFTAGDCRTKTVRQITTATGDGAAAAIAACRYLG
ncbi:MAG: FAD-dependent oxidoreductase, partial [Clostridia bacterium]|nr:FAD-dependent oxidoreductase [Clostridia bacterium]